MSNQLRPYTLQELEHAMDEWKYARAQWGQAKGEVERIKRLLAAAEQTELTTRTQMAEREKKLRQVGKEAL